MSNNADIQLLPQELKEELAQLFHSAVGTITIVTPYFTSYGTKLLANNVSTGFSSRGTLKFLTDLSPLNICAGATQPKALVPLQQQVHRLQLTHLPNLHAKVYIADEERAIVASGNLTRGGLVRNHEYGVLIRSANIVARIRQDVDELATLGTVLSSDDLRVFAQIAEELRRKNEGRIGSARKEQVREFEQSFRQAEDKLIAFRLAGGAITSVFERSVVYLLRKYGALSTQHIHPLIKAIHPDLCDDSVDRVINGQHFGKKWKHAVRRAQSHLKDAGHIERIDGLWHLVKNNK